MAFDRKRYLEPSALCDFDRAPQIKIAALAVSTGARNRRQEFEKLFAFVKELPYGFDDWDVRASDILKQHWGMCSGKTNLLVAMLRSIGIPARYRIYRIKADQALWGKAEQGAPGAEHFKQLGDERDHVDCEAWLGRWIDCDPGRDTPMEKGILKLGGALERIKVTGRNGKVRYLRLANFDDWAKARQARRTFRADRKDVFAGTNKGFEMLREFGRS